MITYNSYEEAKIANPDGDIFHVNGICFFNYEALASDICNPADHCMTVEKFLANGNKFQVGDLFIGIDGDVVDVEAGEHLEEMHKNQESDRYRYILRAAALEERKPRTKVEYVKCGFNSRGAALDCFDNNEELYEPSCNPEGYSSCEDPCNVIDMWDQLYRRIETPVTEREAFIEAAIHELESGMSDRDYAKALYDSGKFKLVN